MHHAHERNGVDAELQQPFYGFTGGVTQRAEPVAVRGERTATSSQ